MRDDDSIRDMARDAAHAARLRHAGEPDPDEVLRVHCANCDRAYKRPRRVIEEANEKYGFWACRPQCRRQQLRKEEHNYNPSRES